MPSPVYQRSLDLAKQINSKEDILISLEDLTFLSIDSGNTDAANSYIDQLTHLLPGGGNRLDELDVLLAQGEIAAARLENEQAETLFRTVERDPASQTSTRLGAEHQLARLYEGQGNTIAAEGMYRTALATFESARAGIENEDSRLPFLANATRIYDDYIHFLVKQGKTDEALAAADQSRARTLAQGLAVDAKKPSLQAAAWRGTDVARKAGAHGSVLLAGRKAIVSLGHYGEEDGAFHASRAVRNISADRTLSQSHPGAECRRRHRATGGRHSLSHAGRARSGPDRPGCERRGGQRWVAEPAQL